MQGKRVRAQPSQTATLPLRGGEEAEDGAVSAAWSNTDEEQEDDVASDERLAEEPGW